MEFNLVNLCASIFLIATLLCIIIAWYYKRLIAPYREFPNVSTATIIRQLLKKVPKDVTALSFNLHAGFEWGKQFQSEGLVFLWFLRPYLIIFNEEAIKFFRNEDSALDKPPHIYAILQDLFGKGLITSNGNQWKKQRKVLSPVFNVAMLKSKVPVLNQQANILVRQLLEIPHHSVDIHKYLKICTFSIICETIIGIDVSERKDEVKHITKLFSEVTHKMMEQVCKPYTHWLHPKYQQYLFPWGKKYYSQVQELREIMTKILLQMKEATLERQKQTSGNETDDACSEPRKSFAQRLVELHLEDPSSFTLKYMIDELITFIFAGYDTTSYALLWCLFLLGHHQDVQDQVYSELESVSKSDLPFQDLPQLTYMECVIKESLRIFSTVPVHARQLEKNIRFGKYTVPKGTTIGFCPYLYHRNPNIFPDPEKFDPDRFLDRSAHKPWTYVPFSEGLRSCIGKRFALMEIKIILFHLLRNFEITSLDRREDVRLSWEIVLVPMKPLHMRLTPRNTPIQTHEV